MSKNPQDSGDFFDMAKPHLCELTMMVNNFCFSLSESGYVGLVPKNALLGDNIFVPFGSEVPIIIRKSDERSGCFRLIGECYIHGMMNGEVLESDAFPSGEIQLH